MTKKKPAPRHRDLVREALLVGALAAQVVLIVALVTFTPRPGGQTHLVGVVGRFVAEVVWNAFGIVGFVLLALGVFTTILALVRRHVTAPLLRVVGGAMMLIGTCALVHQVLRPQIAAGSELLHPFDVVPGGELGRLVFDTLVPPFGALGTLVFSAVVMCTGFAFATDWLLYEMLFEGAQRLAATAALVRRFWPQPATAGAGARGGLRLLPRPRPKSVDDGPPRKTPAGRGASEADEAEEPEATTPRPPRATSPKPTTTQAKVIDTDDGVVVELDDPDVLVPPEMLPGAPAPAAPAAPPPPRDPALDAAEEAALAVDLEFDADDEPTVDEPEDEPEPPRRPFEVHLEPQIRPPQPVELQIPRKQGEYEFPGLDLLDVPKPRDLRQLEQAIQHNADVLQRTLAEFRVEGRVVAYQQGPVVTMLEVALAPGTKVTKIHALADDLAMALKVRSVRIVAPIPGKSTVGVEIPNPTRDDVRMLTLLESPEFRAQKQYIPLFLGTRGNGEPLIDDLTKMPHLLLAGATGSGKSVCINTVLLSILMTRTPDEVKLVLIDPKQVELAFFADIPHLLSPVVTDMKRASSVLEWSVEKMEDRYDLLRRFEVRNIASYNELGEEAIRARIEELGLSDEVIPVRLPYIVIIVDELADLMLSAGKEVEKLITRLAQKSRAVGIHVILATQRPSTDVITGLIKANMPTRIAFQVTSKVDSRVVLDQNGADKLLGMGDMLYLPPRSAALARAQCTFASDKEVKRVVTFLKKRYEQEFNEELVEIGTTDLLDDCEKDNLYDEAVRVVLHEQRGSASLLQRALAIGYTRASRLLDLMRKEGVVGAYKGSKASDVLLTLEEYEGRVAARRADD